ncbi:Mobile element protein [hydrothermal vent metagenome]|uniref:Mobile element protein n=1 Tax=hydrothermal vent metagenome TaxID=652676 RepID=A0A3B0ZI98_9ZZZZ
MDGKGRALDNIMVERLWRSVKYEEIYLNEYESVAALKKSLKRYFRYYNYERPHQSFGDATPAERYTGEAEKKCDHEPKKKSRMSVDKRMDDGVHYTFRFRGQVYRQINRCC